MYNEYFGLRQAPFRITPDTALFYTGGSRGDVLDALVYAITSGEGIVKVVGEVGTGKTMLCRMLEERLPDNVQIAYLANPSLTPEDILHAVALELELDVASDANRLQVMHRLQETLLSRHANNQRVVVLVEEAQSMPVDTLEEIRLLSNLETKNEKLLQIVLFGQPELDENLAQPQIRQLRERITHSFALTPLGREEVKDYVAFRLRASGYRGRDAFTADAYRTMSRASEGLTRRVNIIADKAMLAAFADDTHDVSAKHVKSAIADSEFSAARDRKRRSPALSLVPVIAVAVVVAGTVGWYAGNRASSVTPLMEQPGAQKPTGPLADAAPAASSTAPVQDAPRVPMAVPPVAAVVAAVEPEPAMDATAAPSAPASVVAESESATDAASVAADRSPGDVASSALASVTTTQSLAADAGAARRSASVSEQTVVVSANEGAVAMPAATDSGTGASGAGGVNAAAIAAPPRASVNGAVREAAMVAQVITARDGHDNAPSSALNRAVDRAIVAQTDTATMPASSDESATLPAESSASPQQSAAVVEQVAVSGAVAAVPAPAAGPATVGAPINARPESSRASGAGSAASGKQMYKTLLQWRLAHTQRWLRGSAKNYYSIQLLATDSKQRRNLEAFLVRRERAGHIEQIFVYETRIKAREWYGVLFGEFASVTEAREALRALPRELQVHQPFIRNIKDIKVLG